MIVTRRISREIEKQTVCRIISLWQRIITIYFESFRTKVFYVYNRCFRQITLLFPSCSWGYTRLMSVLSAKIPTTFLTFYVDCVLLFFIVLGCYAMLLFCSSLFYECNDRHKTASIALLSIKTTFLHFKVRNSFLFFFKW